MNNIELLSGIVSALKSERKRLGLSQKDVAEELGLSQTYLSQLENGKKPRFSTAILVRYAETLGTSLPVLFWKGLTEDKVPKEKRAMFRELKPIVDDLIKSIFG